MRVLTPGKEMHDIRDAIRGREYWVLVTDESTAHAAFVGAVLGLASVQRAERAIYGTIEFADRVGGQPTPLSVVLLPKEAVRRDEVNALLATAGSREGLADDQDIAAITRGRPRVMELFIAAASAGNFEAYPADASVN